MNRKARHAAILPFALAALLAGGCENSGITAPSDGAIAVSANPATITIDPNRSQTEGSATITARLTSKDGLPVEGASVFFSATAGSLASLSGGSGGATAVRTNAQGLAQDVLTVGTLGPASIEVTAASGSLSAKVTVAKVIGAANLPPVARVVATPATEQGIGQLVTFDGSTSDDPEDDPITMYKWTITSTNPEGTESVEGPNEVALARTYTQVQTLSGKLEVTTDPRAPLQYNRGETIVYPSRAVFSYRIVQASCSSNVAPVAVIGATSPIQLVGTSGAEVATTLDASLSSDSDGAITSYVWSCGSGTPVLSDGDRRATCTYLVQSTAKTYAATLAVRDDGTGPDGAGGYLCQKNSPTVSVNVVVSPAAAR